MGVAFFDDQPGRILFEFQGELGLFWFVFIAHLGEHKNPGEIRPSWNLGGLPDWKTCFWLAENKCFPPDGSAFEMRPHIVRQTR